jgi:hypothetical protein
MARGGTDKYDDSTGNYTQYVSINGNQVHTLSTSDGYALGFGSAVECAETNCGVVPAHSEFPRRPLEARRISPINPRVSVDQHGHHHERG